MWSSDVGPSEKEGSAHGKCSRAAGFKKPRVAGNDAGTSPIPGGWGAIHFEYSFGSPGEDGSPTSTWCRAGGDRRGNAGRPMYGLPPGGDRLVIVEEAGRLWPF